MRLLDVDELRPEDQVLVAGLLLVFLALSYAFYQRVHSSVGTSLKDLSIITLSLFQLALNLLFYLGFESNTLLLTSRAFKTFQALALVWMLVGSMAQESSPILRVLKLSFILITWSTVGLYLGLLWYRSVQPETSMLCKDITWVILSVVWFASSLLVAFLSYYTVVQLLSAKAGTLEGPHFSTFVPDAVQSPAGTQAEKESARTMPSLGPLANSKKYSKVPLGPSQSTGPYQNPTETKKKHLLVLVSVETLASGITCIWDIVQWKLVDEKSGSCEGFLSVLPLLEKCLFVVTGLIALLLPHVFVFLVFYWVDRETYRPFSEQWDIKIENIEALRNT